MSIYHDNRFNVWVTTVEVDGTVKRGAYSSERLADQADQNASISHDAEYEYAHTVGSFCGFLPFFPAQ